jgi:hypothetical protein
MFFGTSREPAQYAYEKALSSVDGDFVNLIPIFTVSFTYLSIHFDVIL